MIGTTGNQPAQPENPEKHSLNLPADKPDQAIFSYYRDGMGNVGGLKVKWTIRVGTGPAARRDARKAEAIREALEWIRKHGKHQITCRATITTSTPHPPPPVQTPHTPLYGSKSERITVFHRGPGAGERRAAAVAAAARRRRVTCWRR